MAIGSIESKIRKLAFELLKEGRNQAEITREINILFKQATKEFRTELLKTITQEYDWIKDKTLPNDIREMAVDAMKKLNEDFSKLDGRIDNIIGVQLTKMLRTDFNQKSLTSLIELALSTQKYVAKTLSNTITAGLDTLAKIKDLDDDVEMEYTGPPAERSFCIANHNKVRTLGQWKKLNNGQGLSVIMYRGGYNCRHSLEVVI